MKVPFTYVFAFFILVFLAAKVYAESVAVVMSADAKVYQEALEGFREVVRHRIVSVQTLNEKPSGWRDEIRKLRSTIEPDLVFVIGTPALQVVSGDITNIPIVHVLAFNPFSSTISAGKNVYGISMIPSAGQVISLLKELSPKIRRVGTIYDPSRSGLLFSQAHAAFQKSGLQLLGKEAHSAGDIGASLKSLQSDIEILWLWPDEKFLADDILQRILLFSFERKKPLLGLSERHTEMGALLSLSYGSAKDMGNQAGELVNRILGRATTSPAPLTMPRQFKLTVNLKSARKLDVKVPDSIIQRADNAVKAPVYKEGDWWVFRINMIDPSGATKTEVHRVMFSNDKFASDDPSFLSGGDVAGTPYFLPFASVYLTDPARRWLDFPLVAGKKWSFRYRVRGGGFAGGPRFSFKSADADAEVIGKASHPIETAAGKFVAIEIGRTDNVGGILAYYYSPQSQSVVKLRARGSGYQKGQYELELIAYGNGGNMGKDLR
jgi:putative ABC transport system substrate-binding protein